MKTITITFDVTRMEHDLLVAAKADAPNGERVKIMLLSDAAKTLRNMGDAVLSEYRERQRRDYANERYADYPLSSKVDEKTKARISDEQMRAAMKAGMYKASK